MRPWSRTASCWRCSCAAQMRPSLEDSVRLLAHPKSVHAIASVGPIKRKLIKEHRAPGSRQKLKTRRHWYGGLALIDNTVTLPACRVQSRKGTVISPAARICPRRPTLCGRRPLERRYDSVNRAAAYRSLHSFLFRSRALSMASAAISHRDLFKSSISDRRKGITCPSKYLILAVDAPNRSICASRDILQLSRDLSPTIPGPSKNLVLSIDAPDILGVPHRNLFKSSISDRRKGILCPPKDLIFAVDTPDGAIRAGRYILQLSRDLSPTIPSPSKDLVLRVDAPDVLWVPHRNLFESPICHRRKRFACPSKYLILAVDPPDRAI
jgi:hypothetical protein